MDGHGNELDLLPNDFQGFPSISVTFKNCSLANLPQNIFSVNGISDIVFENCSPFVAGRNILDELNNVNWLIISNLPSGDIPATFTSKPKLFRALRLSSVRLGNLGKDFFAHSAGIEDLEIYSNGLQRIPKDLFTPLAGSLQKISLSESTLVLDKDQFSRLQNLKELLLQARPESFSGNMFAGLTSIQKIDLEYNNLSSLPDGLFSGLKTLRYLNIKGNDMVAIKPGTFRDNAALESLIIYFNPIAQLPLTSLNGIKNLKCLIVNTDGYFYSDHNNVLQEYPVLSDKNREVLTQHYTNLKIQPPDGWCEY